MGDHQAGAEKDSPPRLRLLRHPIRSVVQWRRGWRLWHELSPRVQRTVLIIDVLALLLSAYVATLHPIAGVDLERFAILIGAATIHIEATRAIERQREHAAGAGPHLDMMTAWSFAGLLLLPPSLALAMVMFTQAYGWFRIWKNGPVKIYRRTFSGAALLLATSVAILVMESATFYPGGLPELKLEHWILLVVAAALRWAVNYYLVVQVIGLAGPDITAEELFDKFSDQIIDAGTTAAAIVTAVLLVNYPAGVALVLVILVVFHRTVLHSQYQKAAQTDSKTGLLDAAYWKSLAHQIFTREHHRQNKVGMLVIDIDHFKKVNDQYGHAMGDVVLKAVSGIINSEVRSDIDHVCRWGGEEFAVLVPDVTPASLATTAERIRQKIEKTPIVESLGVEWEEIRLTVSVGAALFPDDGKDPEILFREADAAVYKAKEVRNRCCYSDRLAALLSPVSSVNASFDHATDVAHDRLRDRNECP